MTTTASPPVRPLAVSPGWPPATSMSGTMPSTGFSARAGSALSSSAGAGSSPLWSWSASWPRSWLEALRLAVKHVGHPLRGVPLHAFGEVAVNVLGDRDGRVAENLRHHLERRALSQHEAGCRMTCLMRVPVSQPGLLAQPHESLGEVVRVDRSPHQRREDQPVIDPQLPGLRAGPGPGTLDESRALRALRRSGTTPAGCGVS